MKKFLTEWRKYINEFGEGRIQTMRIFDFDDTIAETEADVIIKRPPNFEEERITPAEFAVYEPIPNISTENPRIKKNEIGELFDFVEFNKIINPVKLKHVTAIFKRLMAAGPGGRWVSILTARGPAAEEEIRGFLKVLLSESGLEPSLIDGMEVICLGSSDPLDKARWILNAARGHEDSLRLIEFFDDSPKNRAAVDMMLSRKMPNIKTVVIDPVDLEGKTSSFVHVDKYKEDE
tara:strand:- start:1094 stop:1795 length:702 start_codon:yes stop_codon:yes gene_type:complete